MTTDTFETRMGRITDCVELKKPDRVPIFTWFHYLPATYADMTFEDAFYDLDGWLAANEKMIVDYDPDLHIHISAAVGTGGAVHEALGTQQIKWPGHGVASNRPFQFVEGEYMKAEEYDEFLFDPSDWIVRKFLPRVFSNLAGLGQMPPISSMLTGYAGAGTTAVLAAPPVAAALEALSKASQEAMKWSMAYGQFTAKLGELGYPTFGNNVSMAPYDLISDMGRGMRGTMKDMYRAPDKLMAAQERVLPILLGGAIGQAQMSNNPLIFMPLHRGADGFMSNEQFEKFYWPPLKALIYALIDAGLVPCPFFEGTYDQRLEYLTELPEGKVMGSFDRSDMNKVKEILGGKMCITGGMPISLLQHGTPEKVRDETKKIIETIGQDGAFIMSSSSVLDEADPELVRVWVETTKEFGQY